METFIAPPSLQKLAEQWKLFGMLLVVFGRRLSAMKKIGARGGAAEAEQLQLLAGAAVVQLNRQIALIPEQSLDEEDVHHFNHLKAIAVALLALAMLAQKLRGDFVKLGKASADYARIGEWRSENAAPSRLLLDDMPRAVELIDPG